MHNKVSNNQTLYSMCLTQRGTFLVLRNQFKKNLFKIKLVSEHYTTIGIYSKINGEFQDIQRNKFNSGIKV